MASIANLRNIVVRAVCLLCIILFVYAAVSKLLDFENFQVQLGQSPLVGVYGTLLSYAVPAIEILISVGLAWSSYQKIALWASFLLMSLFTAYIFIMLHYSPFVPCSCGGVLSSLGWREHLVFNIFYTLLAAVGILFKSGGTKSMWYYRLPFTSFVLLVVFFASGCFVFMLHLAAEEKFTSENPFIRRYIPGTAVKDKEMTLANNDYYFAGSDSGKIYLANHKAPLHVLEIDTLLHKKHEYQIILPHYRYQFRSVQVQVRAPYFYLMDGSIPLLFKGKTADWKAIALGGDYSFFTRAEAIDTSRVVFRGQDRVSKNNRLGYFTTSGRLRWGMGQAKLDRQVDGVFDSDGLLLSDVSSGIFLYVYFYRNRYFYSDAQLRLPTYSETIDTISNAVIKVVLVDGKTKRKMAAPPHIVNKHACAADGRLFIHSGSIGKLEPKEMWKTASIVDVYDYNKQRYLSSLYVHHSGALSMHDFIVIGDNMYVLLGYHLHRYKLGGDLRPKGK